MSASGNCSNADVGLVLTTSPGMVAGHLLETAGLENFGPCNATHLTFTDRLPNITAVTFVKLNPSSWSCSTTQGASSSTVSCVLRTLSGSGASPENPSTAVIQFDVQQPAAGGDVTNAASASADQTDPNPSNNQLWGGVLTPAGGSLGSTSTTSAPQTVHDSIPPGTYGSTFVQILDDPTSTCPSGISATCFGTAPVSVKTVTTDAEHPQVLVFTYLKSILASAGFTTPASVPIYHELDNTSSFLKLAQCPAGEPDGDLGQPNGDEIPAQGCVHGATVSGDATHYIITVYSPTNGHWM